MTHQGLRITPKSMTYRDTAYLKICTHGGRDEFSDLFRRTRERGVKMHGDKSEMCNIPAVKRGVWIL